MPCVYPMTHVLFLFDSAHGQKSRRWPTLDWTPNKPLTTFFFTFTMTGFHPSSIRIRFFRKSILFQWKYSHFVSKTELKQLRLMIMFQVFRKKSLKSLCIHLNEFLSWNKFVRPIGYVRPEKHRSRVS